MCCFSLPIQSVTDTQIFCRMGASGNQVVVYGMTLDAKEDLAMILPIPVVPDSAENAVRFLDFSKYPKFFDDLYRHFAGAKVSSNDTFSAGGGLAPREKTLDVKQVGNFEASFVPKIADFERLDERFRLPTKIWSSLPQFADYGFVVFKLRAGAAKVHPMAFAYPARDRNKIVFPTVHIHDGHVHEQAEFDHELYVQAPSAEVRMAWYESSTPAFRYTDIPKTNGAVRPTLHLYLTQRKGSYKNEDVAIACDPVLSGQTDEEKQEA